MVTHIEMGAFSQESSNSAGRYVRVVTSSRYEGCSCQEQDEPEPRRSAAPRGSEDCPPAAGFLRTFRGPQAGSGERALDGARRAFVRELGALPVGDEERWAAHLLDDEPVAFEAAVEAMTLDEVFVELGEIFVTRHVARPLEPSRAVRARYPQPA